MSDPAITTDSVSTAPPPEAIQAPEPVKIEPRPAVKEEPKKPSLRESMDAAKAKLEAKEKADADPNALKTKEPAAKVDSKVEAKAKADADVEAKTKAETATKERARGEHGHFAPDPAKSDAENEAARIEAEKAATRTPAKVEPGQEHRQAPSRFSQAAKDAWATVPEETQKETHRAFRELEAGLVKHREGSQRYTDVYKTYDELAKNSNVDPKATLESYVTIDRALHSKDPQQIVGAINRVIQSAGIEPQQYAQAMLKGQAPASGQQPDNGGQQQQPSAEVIELRKTVAEMQKKLGGVEQHLQSQTMTQHEQTLTDWAKDKPHFGLLRGEVTRLVKDEGLSPDDAYASALVAAQDQARGLLGDEASKSREPNPFTVVAEELDEQIAKGSRSIRGAPGNGSSPPPRKSGPPPPIRESIQRAKAKLGV